MKEYSISHLPVFHFLLVLIVCINQLVVLRVIQKLVESVCNSLVLVVVHDVVQARFAVDFLETVDVNLSVVVLAVLIQRKEGNVLFVVYREDGKYGALLNGSIVRVRVTVASPSVPQPSQPLQSSLVQGVTPLLFSKSLISDTSFSIRFTLRCVVSLYQMHMKKASPIMKNLYKPGEVGYNEG